DRREKTHPGVEIKCSSSSVLAGCPLVISPAADSFNDETYQLISEMAIDLEKRSGADAVRCASALINEMIGSADRETLRIVVSFKFAGTNSYKHDAAGLWQRGPEVRGKLFGS